MDPNVQVALVVTSGTISGAAIAAWSTRSVRKAKQKTEDNAAAIAEKKFSMDYWERRATIAIADAERWEHDYREEHAANLVLDTANRKLDEMNRRLLRELEECYGEHPDLEARYRKPYPDSGTEPSDDAG